LGESPLKLFYAVLFSFMPLGSPCGYPTQENKKYATFIIKITVQVGAENFLPLLFQKSMNKFFLPRISPPRFAAAKRRQREG
jgi:hypothetical protein